MFYFKKLWEMVCMMTLKTANFVTPLSNCADDGNSKKCIQSKTSKKQSNINLLGFLNYFKVL